MPRPEQGEARPAKKRRLARHLQTVREIGRDPASIPNRLRALLLGIWCSRGGGFYGLGYLIAFVCFEIDLMVGEIRESDGAGEFLAAQAVEYLLRLGFLSFVNMFKALLWPLMVAGWWGGWGLALLISSYLAFERVLKPLVDAQFPELAEHREQRLRAKADKRDKRRRRRQSGRWLKRSGKQPKGNEGRVK